MSSPVRFFDRIVTPPGETSMLGSPCESGFTVLTDATSNVNLSCANAINLGVNDPAITSPSNATAVTAIRALDARGEKTRPHAPEATRFAPPAASLHRIHPARVTLEF